MLKTRIEELLKHFPRSNKYDAWGSWYWDGQSTIKVHHRYMHMPPTIGQIRSTLDKAGVKYIMPNSTTFIIHSF